MGEFESSSLGRVTVYSIQGCQQCEQAKATLRHLEVPVCDVDVGTHPELRARLKELTGCSTVPQIFFNSVHVGGSDDLQKLVRRRNRIRINLVKCICFSFFTIYLCIFEDYGTNRIATIIIQNCVMKIKHRKVQRVQLVDLPLPSQAPEELQRLVTLVKETPPPADAPPLPKESEAAGTAGDTDGGEKLLVITKKRFLPPGNVS